MRISFASSSGDSMSYDSMSIGLNVAEIPGSISMVSRMMAMCACLRLGMRKSATCAKSLMARARARWVFHWLCESHKPLSRRLSRASRWALVSLAGSASVNSMSNGPPE